MEEASLPLHDPQMRLGDHLDPVLRRGGHSSVLLHLTSVEHDGAGYEV